VVRPSYQPRYRAISDNALFPCVSPGRPVCDKPDQQKARGVILLLHYVKSCYARLLYAVAGVFECGGLKCFNVFGLNVDKNMDYKHNILLIGFYISGGILPNKLSMDK